MNKSTKNDLLYALSNLVDAIEKSTIANNAYPLNEKKLKEIEKADFDLNRALTLAKELIEN
jgi:hypothetical protein